MILIPEWAPNIHPMLVHFPLVLLFFAVFMDLLTFFIPVDWWDERKSTVTFLAGAASAVVVFITGQMAADAVQIPETAFEAVGEHAGWAEWTVWFFSIYALVRLWLSVTRRMKRRPVHLLMFAVSLVGLFLLYETGQHGAKLVFGYGLGTGSLVEQSPTASTAGGSPGGFVQDYKGNWTWVVGPDAGEVLENRFSVPGGSGTAGSGTIKTVAGSDSSLVLRLPADSVFIATDENYSDFDYRLSGDFSSLQGSLRVVHHLRDAKNYDSMVLGPGDTVSLVRVKNGSETVIEQATADWHRAGNLRFVNSGEHQRGYLDGELILHGHEEEAPKGGIGIRADGSGFIEVGKMQLTRLEGEEHHEEGEEHHEHQSR